MYSRGKKKLFRSSVGRRYITRYIRSVVKHQGNWFSQRYNLELAGNKRCCVSASRQLVSYNVTRFILHIYSLGRLTFDSVLREWVRIQDKKNSFQLLIRYILIDKTKRLYYFFFQLLSRLVVILLINPAR